MNKKQALQQLLKEEQMNTLDKKHIALLEKNILSTIRKNRSSYSFFAYLRNLKYFVIPPVSLAVILLVILSFLTIGKKLSHNGQLPHHNFIQQVSAEGLLQAMQASITSERLHVIMHMSSNGPDTSNEIDSSGDYSEIWIDRKNHLSRLERKDSQNRLRVLIIKQGLPSENDMTYQFILAGMHTYPLDLSLKKGFFVSRTDHDGYESNMDLTLRNDYLDYLKKNGVQVDPSYQQTTYKGHPAYKLILKFSKDKMGGIRTETLTIDKETQLPYEDIDQYSGGPANTAFPITTTYSFSTDFSNDIFDRKAPQGYTLTQNSKIEDFDLVLPGYNSKSSLSELWKQERQLGIPTIDEGDGMMPDGYRYKIFISKESFSSQEAASKATNPQFNEIKPHEAMQKLNNISTQVYTLPDIPGNDFTQYGIFKLEVDDKTGKMLYEVTKIKEYKSFIPPALL